MLLSSVNMASKYRREFFNRDFKKKYVSSCRASFSAGTWMMWCRFGGGCFLGWGRRVVVCKLGEGWWVLGRRFEAGVS